MKRFVLGRRREKKRKRETAENKGLKYLLGVSPHYIHVSALVSTEKTFLITLAKKALFLSLSVLLACSIIPTF